MESVKTIISPTIHTVRSGVGWDAKIEVFILKGETWQLSKTFYESDDYMMTNLRRHLNHLQESLTQSSSM
jgi:hypothetical protein